MAQAEAIVFRVGQEVWIPHAKEGWICGEILSIDGGSKQELLVRPEDGGDEIRIAKDKALMKNPEILEGVPDLAQLSYMHEPGILYNLQSRYYIDLIYTYIGKILIAINPYARLPLFGKDMIRAYYGQPLGALAPHVYAIAQDAFKDMRIEGTSQSILVSGESGAGKTETTKFLLQYFAAMGNMLRTQESASNKKGDTRVFDSKSVEERVLESTPLLEAFGNAKTLRNDNSSRFGKFIEIHFDDYGFILGARIQTYLLEKSRIFKQVTNERNYHIFYQFLTGATDEMKANYSLREPEFYNYLNQSQCISIDGVSDKESFGHTLTAMAVSGGISDQEKLDVFCLLATVLWLGNITFLKRKYDDTVEINSPDALKTVANLITCSPDELAKALTTRTVVMRNEKLTMAMTVEQSQSARDSLSMLLYSQMFEWLVAKINKSIHQQGKSKFFIGVLDIYGFESFTKNSFEQFCINYANEKLQQLFNQHVFKEEQQEYVKEKISWSYIDFVDNQDTLDLIEKKPMCILTLLDEESQFPKATSMTLADKLCKALASHPKFEKPRFSTKTGAFTILHYAGKVTYDTDTFLDKNKDYILPEQITLLKNCKNPFFRSLLPAHALDQQQFKFVSVGSQFSNSLSGLMKTICSTSPHYIRCIKPNPSKSPQVFVKDDVMHQLKCGGVMESVRICCAGYPTRRPIDKFYERYRMLLKDAQGSNPKQLAVSLLSGLKFPEDKYKIGMTKVFMRAGLIAKLEDMRNTKLNEACVVIQKYYKGFFRRREYLTTRKAAICYQTYIRRCVSQLELRHLREKAAAISIQTFYRAISCRVGFQGMQRSAIILQRAIRISASKKELSALKHDYAISAIQTVIRKTLARKDYLRKIQGIKRLQAKWRGKIARKQYVQLRIEARSVRSLQDQKSQLAQKLEEMQWRLSAEARVRHAAEKEKDEITKALEEVKEKHANELIEAKKKFSVSSDEYNNLSHQLEQARRDISVLQDAKLNLENKFAEQEAAEEKHQKQIHALLLDLSVQKELVQAKQAEIDNVKYLATQLEKEKARMETHAEEVKTFHENQLREIRNQKEDLEAAQEGLKAEVRKWQENAKANATRKSNLELEVSALTQKLVVNQEGGLKLQAQLAELQQVAADSESRNEESSTHIEQLKKDILSNSEKNETTHTFALSAQEASWKARWEEREEEHQKKWADLSKQWDEKEKQWVDKERQWSDKEKEWQRRENQWAEMDAEKESKSNEQWVEKKQELQKKWGEQTRVWETKEKGWADNERQWAENQRQWSEKERQWAIKDAEKEAIAKEQLEGKISEQELEWKTKWSNREEQFNAKLNEQRIKWNELENTRTQTERQWDEKAKRWEELERQWAEKERQWAEKEIATEKLLNDEWLAKLLGQEKLWNEKWIERETEQEKRWNEQERKRVDEAQEKDQTMLTQERVWTERLAFEVQKHEEATKKHSKEHHEAISQWEVKFDAQSQQFHTFQAQALLVDAERQRAQLQLLERERELSSVQTKLSQVQEKYKTGIERLNTEKQQLQEQIDKYNLEKMREGIESNAKTMVDAVKQQLEVSNLEKDIIRLKMEADRVTQAHELEEKNWKRTEAELKENITRIDSELKQHQALRAKFEGDFFGLKEKSSTATQESFYLKEVNAQLQNNIQKFEAEITEKKQQYESLVQESDSVKKAHSALQLENQNLLAKINYLDQSVQSAEKKKSKLKEFEEAVGAKLEAKKAEIVELKSSHTKELAVLQRTIEEQKEKITGFSTETFKQQLKEQQMESNQNRLKEDLDRAKDDYSKLKKKHKQSKSKSATKLMEETSNYKVQIELLKKEVAEMTDKSKYKEKEKEKEREEREKDKEKEKEKGEAGDKAVKVLQDRNSELVGEMARVQDDLSRSLIENARVVQEHNQIWLENEKLVLENAELREQLHKYFEDLQSRVDDLDSNENGRGGLSGNSSPKSADLEVSLKNKNWHMEDKEVSMNTQNYDLQIMIEENQKQKDLIRKADTDRIALESSVRSLTEEKVFLAQRLQRAESEYTDMKKLYAPLKIKSEKLKMLEKINDAKETEYQKLARSIGYEPTPTMVIFRELTNFGDHRHLDFVKLIYHQITYWNIIEFEDLPVLQSVINSYSNLINRHANDLDVLTHIFSGASLLLYMLYKNRNADLEDVILVDNLEVKQPNQSQQLQDQGRARGSGSFSFNSLTLHNMQAPGSLGRSSMHQQAMDSTLFTPRSPTPDVNSLLSMSLSQSPLSSSQTSPAPSPSPSPTPGQAPPSGLVERGMGNNNSKLTPRPLRSSGDFFAQLKSLVGKCFGLLLSFVASRLDPLLDASILVENFSSKRRSELPSLRPVIAFLQKTLSVFQVNLVYLTLSQQFFAEVFSRINNILMNGVLLRQNFCTETFGAYLKSQIESIQALQDDMGSMWIGDVASCFQGIKQIAGVLALANKNSLADDKIRRAICPALNSLQLRQLLSMFTPGEFGKRVPIPIINAIGAKAPHSDSDRILLDTNVVKPFPVKILHYFEVEDMVKAPTSPTVRSLVDNLTANK